MEEKKTYSHLNARPVLDEVNRLIADYEAKKEEIRQNYIPRMWTPKPRASGYKMNDVYKRLSIFDWWVDTLGYSHLIKMRSFLREAIKLGFTGYVCFKVGASGCANGMWAYEEESTNGYSPDCDVLYHSFTPDYSYWDFCVNGKWATTADNWRSIKTTAQLEKQFFGF